MNNRRSSDDVASNMKCTLGEEASICTASTGTSSSCSNCWSDTSVEINGNSSITEKYTCIFDDYDILPSTLGIGRYGHVKECIKQRTGQRFAVKSIKKSKAKRIDHIQREVELLRTIHHPSIMKMVDSYEDAQYVHIVTEKYRGGELFDVIIDKTTSNGCLPEAEAVKIIKSLLEAVHYLHGMNIVHRDIKPENVIFVSSEEGASVKLIDFGLARKHEIGEAGMSNAVGTPYYVSPDVIKGSYDRSCDIWSVGVLAYILLCGYPPFNGSSYNEIGDSILKGCISFKQKVWDGLSDASRDFISKLLCSQNTCTAEEALDHQWIVEHANP